MVSEKKNTKPVYGFFFKNVVCTLSFFFFGRKKKTIFGLVVFLFGYKEENHR